MPSWLARGQSLESRSSRAWSILCSLSAVWHLNVLFSQAQRALRGTNCFHVDTQHLKIVLDVWGVTDFFLLWLLPAAWGWGVDGLWKRWEEEKKDLREGCLTSHWGNSQDRSRMNKGRDTCLGAGKREQYEEILKKLFPSFLTFLWDNLWPTARSYFTYLWSFVLFHLLFKASVVYLQYTLTLYIKKK